MSLKFVNNFIIQIDAIFNTNTLNILLLILIEITNTMSSFLLAYTFIFSEFAEVIKFVNACCKELFFWDDCLGLVVMLRDFSLDLLVAIVRKAGISIVKVEINQAYELFNYLDVLVSDCILQSCFWHIVEDFKAWLIKERYSKEVRKEINIGLHSLIWKSNHLQ